MASRPHPINDGIQPPTGRWHRATVDRHLHPSESLPSSNHILLAKALYFARHCSNSHTCALACHKYIALDGVATRIENLCVWRLSRAVISDQEFAYLEQ